MVRIPLIGVPRHLWQKITGGFNASPGLIAWRLTITLGSIILSGFVLAATGGTGVVGIAFVVILTTILSHVIRDDAIAVWGDLWNARWGEVEV